MKKIILPLLLLIDTASALPFSSQDTRSIAMGGTGVASSNPGSAAAFNPALLSHYSEDQSFSIILPNFSLAVTANRDVIDAFQEVNDKGYIDNMTDAISQMNKLDRKTFSHAAKDFENNSDALSDNLISISGHPVTASINPINFALSFPNSQFGFSIYTSSTAYIEAVSHVSDCDIELLTEYAKFATGIDKSNPTLKPSETRSFDCKERKGTTYTLTDKNGKLVNPKNGTDVDGRSYLISSAEVGVIAIGELGMAIAHEFVIHGVPVSFGLTPKVSTIRTFYVFPTVQSISDGTFEMDDYKDSYTSDTGFTADIGVAVDLLDDEALTIGLVVKNIIPQSYDSIPFVQGDDTAATRTFTLDPQARMGVSWQKFGLVLTSDIDLTENKPLLLGDNTQYIGFGAEYDIADANILRLRLGAKSNLKDDTESTFSAGLALNILAAHIDFGAEYGDQNAALGLQFGLDF